MTPWAARCELELERGGKPFNVQVTVQDLHAITPASFLEFGDAIVHTLSYQEARHFHLPISGVFVAASGYSLDAAGVPRGAVITAVDSKPVATLADFRDRGRDAARRGALHGALRDTR